MITKTINRPLAAMVLIGAVTLFMTTAGALGIVSFRHQITRLAHHSKYLEGQLVKTENRQSYLASKIAAVHNPAYLKKHIKEGLRTPIEKQVVWVNESVGTSKKISDPVTAPKQEPFSVSFDLAFLATTSR